MRYLITSLLLAVAAFAENPTIPPAEWIKIFNGKDFTGWGRAGKTEHLGYTISEGAIQSGEKSQYLFTDAEFTNYVFDVEFLLTPGANNGIGIHYPGTGHPSWDGIEIQTLDDSAEKYKDLKEWQFHGSLYSLTAAKRGHLKPVGEWNHQRIIVSGDMVSIILNGQLILSTSLSKEEAEHPDHKGAKRRSGRIAFCGHGDIVKYRNLRVLNLGE